MTAIFISFSGIIRQEKDPGGEVLVDSPTQGKEGTCSFQDLVEHSGHLSLVSTQGHMISFFYVLVLFFFFFLPEKKGRILDYFRRDLSVFS